MSREPAGRPAAAEDGRQHDQHEDGEQVLDDQPADGDMARPGVQVAGVGQHAQQDDRAGHRDRQAEDDGRREAPSGGQTDPGPQHRGDQAPHQGPGHHDLAHGQQLLQVELQPDAEHQQDDADLGELAGEGVVGHEARRVRPHDEPGQQVADDRREPQAEGQIAADQGGGQPARQCEDQVDVVHGTDCAPIGRTPATGLRAGPDRRSFGPRARCRVNGAYCRRHHLRAEALKERSTS